MVTIETPTILNGSVLLKYSSNLADPTFYIYIDGALVTVTRQTEYLLPVNIGESYIAEILDDPNVSPTEVFPGKMQLSWFYVPGTSYYRIEEYINAAWVVRQKVPEKNGIYLKWTSRFLEDGANHKFRIVPVGTDGNDGTAREFTILMVRNPDAPDVNYSYWGGGKIVYIAENI